MRSQEIKTLGINSSKGYHSYLSENNRGIQIINVTSITQKNEKFKLILDKKIHNLEAIEFKVAGNQIDSDKIKVIVYDKDTNALLIKPAQDLQKQFTELSNDEIKIVSDLKFLIKRAEDWYEENGDEIKLPKRTSHLNSPTANDFFSDMKPSPDQEAGIEAIFNEPLSYIWGAPGTGKTRLVLAYSLIHYIRAGKQVAIFAATNNALEQILYGVLDMTTEANIEDNKILRLGAPSSEFANAHPNSCEMTGVQRQIDEINNQIQIVKDAIGHNKTSEALETAKYESQKIFSQLEDVDTSKKEIFLVIKSVEKATSSNQFAIDKIQLQILELEKSIRQKEKIVSSLLYKLKKKFTKNTDLEIALRKEKIKLQTRKDKSEIQENKIQKLKKKHSELEIIYNDTSKITKLIENLKEICANDENTKNIISNITFQTYKSTESKLNEYLREHSETLITSEYSSLTEQELVKKLQSWEDQKNHLESESEERIKNANVIALTLDCYIGRYKDKKLPVEHYFLDEAGYANLIKALTLFRKNIPITFLGDHMQLPPVCEMNDRDIKDENQDVFMWAQSALYAEWIFKKDEEESFLDYSKNSPYVFQKMKKVDLKHTYRFGSALAHTLEEFVYQNGFVAHDQNGETKIYYIHAPHVYPQPLVTRNGRDTPSRENAFEASKILELLNILDKDNFAILTPYKKQVTLLGNTLPEARRDQRIMTVHRSQGREWSDVVLSVVDTDRMWFVDSLNKTSRGINVLNTAVSRAKKRLFIVCNYNFWSRQDEQLLKGLLDAATPIEI